MANKLILASAGAGKTYYICNNINSEKRNLIIAYTHENIDNLLKEICHAHQCVPEITKVMTFHAFVYHHIILPYEPTIGTFFSKQNFCSKGICLSEPPSNGFLNKKGEFIHNYSYNKKNNLRHYVTKCNQYYCSTLCELALLVNLDEKSLVERAVKRLSKFYDAIFIDEFQDYRGYEYDLILDIAKKFKNTLLVGDFYQHSVSAKNNSGKPYKIGHQDVIYSTFINDMVNCGFEVDTTTLSKSRRCSIEICNFINSKLGINISSTGQNEGRVIFIDNLIFAKEILSNNDIIKLVYNNSKSFLFKAINWSYSKGDTLNSTCVILTEKFENLDSKLFSIERISISSLNKLYVALTRSCGNLYILKSSMFKKLKKQFII